MTRRLFLRVPLLLALFLGTVSLAPPAGAPAPTAVQKSQLRVSRHFAAGLEYLLVEPRDVSPRAVLPLIVALHGRGGRPVAPQRAYLELEEPVRLILPRGPLRQGDGYAWMPVSAHRGESPALVRPLRERVRQLEEALAEWRRRYPTRGRPIVTGFSQGGILSATLAVMRPEAIAAAFPVAGWIPPSLLPGPYDPGAPHAPIYALHGSDDEILGAARTRAQMRRLRRQGYPVGYEEFRGVAHEVDPRMRARLRQLVERALRSLPEDATGAGLS